MGESPRIDSLKTVGRYTLIEKLSDGYLGPVYKSFDQESGRSVEIRIFCDGIKWDQDLVELFRKECSSVSRLQHPNIGSIIEVSTEGKFPYMVLEPLGNKTLGELIARKSEVSFENKVSIMIEVVEGLGFAHRHGIVHRNLCPENIHFSKDGCIKIRDLVITHVLMKHLPHPGVRWGKPIYLSPEQIQHKQSDNQSDIFALGTIFYELLTGVHPYYNADSNKALDNILQNRLIPTFERYPHFHPRIWQIIKKCLAKNRDDRYENANELLKALQKFLKEMNEDVRLMLNEIQASFASLKIAAERPGATEKCVRLFNDVWTILRDTDAVGYVRLDMLITDLNEVYPEIQASVVKHEEPGAFQPAIPPEDLEVTSDPDSFENQKSGRSSNQPELFSPRNEDSTTVSAATAKDAFAEEAGREGSLPDTSTPEEFSGTVNPGAAETVIPDESGTKNRLSQEGGMPFRNTEDTGSSDYGSVPENPVGGNSLNNPPLDPDAGRPESRGPETSGKRALPAWKKSPMPKSISRILSAFMLVALIVAAVFAFQGLGAGETFRSAWKNWLLDSSATVKASVQNQSSGEVPADRSIGVAGFPADESASGKEASSALEMVESVNPKDRNVASFSVEHSHGFLRGKCRGELEIGYSEVVYRPSSGSHGFQVPRKILKLERDRNTIALYFTSDNELFQKFNFAEEQAAEQFGQVWVELTSLSQK